MPPQIKRLLLLFAIFIGLFLLIRHFLVPESFGKFGHYRGLSLEENAAKKLHYAGRESCAECHLEIADQLSTDLHDILSCESCHGAGLAHAESPDSTGMFRPKEREFCGLCHAFNPARRSDAVHQVDLAEHNAGKYCIDCHNPHAPWELKNQTPTGESF